MSLKVCVLSRDEADDWTGRGVVPNCADHRHVKRLDACQMAHHGDFSPYAKPIAKLIGPHHIVMGTAWVWRAKASGRAVCHGAPVLRVMQLLES